VGFAVTRRPPLSYDQLDSLPERPRFVRVSVLDPLLAIAAALFPASRPGASCGAALAYWLGSGPIGRATAYPVADATIHDARMAGAVELLRALGRAGVPSTRVDVTTPPDHWRVHAAWALWSGLELPDATRRLLAAGIVSHPLYGAASAPILAALPSVDPMRREPDV
jgi:hypothetical protein